MKKVDVKFEKDDDGIYDCGLGLDGDVDTVFGYETSINMSVLTDSIATRNEVSNILRRRGWVGNENNDNQAFEIGSKLWLKYQSKNTNSDKNEAVDYVRSALEHFVPDRAERLKVTGVITAKGIEITASIIRYDGEIDTVLLKLWDTTGDTL